VRCPTGSEWELYIPSELAYGEAGAGADIPGGAALVFTMEIKKVHGKTKKDFKRFEPIPEEFKKKKKVKEPPVWTPDPEEGWQKMEL
jgi:hypothetical protein